MKVETNKNVSSALRSSNLVMKWGDWSVFVDFIGVAYAVGGVQRDQGAALPTSCMDDRYDKNMGVYNRGLGWATSHDLGTFFLLFLVVSYQRAV